jgi:hypothetical protein
MRKTKIPNSNKDVYRLSLANPCEWRMIKSTIAEFLGATD